MGKSIRDPRASARPRLVWCGLSPLLPADEGKTQKLTHQFSIVWVRPIGLDQTRPPDFKRALSEGHLPIAFWGGPRKVS